MSADIPVRLAESIVGRRLAMARGFLAVVGMVLLLSGCLAPPPLATVAPAANPATPIPTLKGSATAQDREELAKNERKWLASGVSRYRIAVHRTNQWTLDQTDTMTVEAGRVTGHTVVCHPPVARDAARCAPDPRDILDVPDLFRGARAILDDTTNAPAVSYEPTYGYPAKVAVRSATRDGQPVKTDTFFNQSVVEFAALP